MNKAYLLAICLLLTPFTGCIEDPALEPAENVDEPDNTEEKTEVRPTEQWTFYRDFVECDPNNDSIVAYGEFVDCLNMDLVNDGESVVAASSEFANEMFNIADLDMDGNLTSSEFDYIKNYPHELIKGCMNSTANNYNANATEEDNTCDYDLDDDGVLDADEILGCTNSTANNYNAEATEEDNTCDYDLDDDGILDSDEALGCTNSTALNYNPEATEEDNTCVFIFQPQTKDELETALIPESYDDGFHTLSSTYGEINTWDTSLITDMSYLIYKAYYFNHDISDWDVSNVTNMERMFRSAYAFNQDISDWDVSSVTTMEWMFFEAENFNQNISDWDVSSVTNMERMFEYATSFNQDISGWDVSSVTYMNWMFSEAESFNQDISDWDVSNVTDMTGMFYGANDLSDDNKCAIHTSFSSNDNWEYDWEEYCPEPFQPETRNELKIAVDEWIHDSDSARVQYGEINTWDTSLITDMSELFYDTTFNDDISDWDVLNVNNMNSIFAFATDFNQDISDWDVSSVTDMAWMFHGASNFNGDLSNWDVSSVTYMNAMFYNAENFNQDISEWDVSSVTAMNQMFGGADDLSDDNKCAIHTSFSSNDDWPYDWDEYCSDD